MRILSLVPRGATDIRDASGQTFDAIGTRRVRASFAFVAAVICVAFAAVLLLFALVRGVRQYRVTHATVDRRLPAASVLGGCLDTLRDVTWSARGGWSPALARRAAAALRVAGAVALGRTVTQDVAGPGAAASDGQVAVRTGWVRRQRVLLSAPITAAAIHGHLHNGHAVGGDARAGLEPIGEALSALTVASYGREWKVDGPDLDAALGACQDAIKR
jgi:hypothetical protein